GAPGGAVKAGGVGGMALKGVTMRSVRAKFLKDVAPLHRLALVWCERAAPPLLLADDSREGGSLWRDCLAIVRNLTLLNNARTRAGGSGGGGAGSSSPQEGLGEDAITRESMALCDNTVVLDGEGVRSALRLAAHPVNAPAKELLGLLESLVLRAARSRAAYKGTGGGATMGIHLGGSGTASTAGNASSSGAVATPAKKPRLNPVSPSSSSPAGRGGGGGGGGGRSASVMTGASSPGAPGAAGGTRLG
ncbi:unnamed protein product, partial [Scytosiphon promiscuus]